MKLIKIAMAEFCDRWAAIDAVTKSYTQKKLRISEVIPLI